MKVIIKQIRVKHWIKNLLIFAPLLFSSQLLNTQSLVLSIFAFFSFSFLASFSYVINDIKDLDGDIIHPIKKNRPLASGKINIKAAYVLAFFMLLFSIIFSILIHQAELYVVLVSYCIINIFYATYLKKISIVDAISIAIGFELRILAGCIAIGVIASDFILVVTFFLALLLAFLKRKGELKLLQENSTKHRKSLTYYTLPLLDKFIFASATFTLIGYLFYTIDDGVINQIGNDYLKYSIVFVLYGLFRFIQLSEIDVYNNEGDPTILIYKDRGLQLAILCWMVYVTMCLYVF